MKFLSMFLCSFLFMNMAHAQLDVAVDTVQRYFLEGGKRFQTLKVSNNSGDSSFEIGAELYRYTNIHDRKTHEAEFEPVQGHFLLAPKKFKLEPGQTRSIRLVHTKQHDDKEHVYRLNFIPKLITDNVGSNNEDAQGVKPSAKVITAAGMLILVSPKEPKLDISYNRDDAGITFTNTGNVAGDFRLTKEYCYNSNIESSCMKLPGKRLYPGEQWRFEVASDIPLRWAVLAYKDIQKWLDIPAVD